MHILSVIIEVIFSPFSFYLKTNISPAKLSKWGKIGVILLISILIVGLLVLYFYREQIFK